MSATLRLRQLLFIAAALALVSLGLVAAFAPVSSARADAGGGEPCVETQDSYTEWVNEGAAIQTLANTPPGADTDTVQYLPAGTVQVGNGDAVEATPDHFENLSWFVWTGGPRDVAPGLDEDGWNDVPALPNGLPHDPVPGTVYNVAHGASGNGSWFKYDGTFVPGTPGQEETFHTEYLWQKQVRTFVPGNECPPQGPDCEANPQAEGCPPVDNGKKIVVCKYVGTPPGELDHIVIVSENTLNNLVDDNGNPFSGSFPFSWTDAQGQTTEGSIAIRYATDGEQAQTVSLSECPGGEQPEVCPEGTDHAGDPFPVPGDEESCNEEPNPGPDTCPEGTDKAGETIPQGETAEEFCDDDNDEDVCPEGTDHAGDPFPVDGDEKSCNDDDVNPGPNCDEDPTQEGCDEGKPNNPGQPNSPSNGPTVKGAQATAPGATNAPAGQSAGTPAARVPTAVDAGLGGPQELAGNGGNLGLLGIAAAMLGAAMIGVSFRPRRGRSLTG
jgi:hypothetical protein